MIQYFSSVDYGTYEWRNPLTDTVMQVRIYYPDADLFCYADLPEFKDPFAQQRLLSPTLQWQMMIFWTAMRETSAFDWLNITMGDDPADCDDPTPVPKVSRPGLSRQKKLENNVS